MVPCIKLKVNRQCSEAKIQSYLKTCNCLVMPVFRQVASHPGCVVRAGVFIAVRFSVNVGNLGKGEAGQGPASSLLTLGPATRPALSRHNGPS